MSVQAKVAVDKQNHPERYCPAPGCLWKTAKLNREKQEYEGGGYCPRHAHLAPKPKPEPEVESIPWGDAMAHRSRIPEKRNRITAMEWFRNGGRFSLLIGLMLLASAVARCNDLPDAPIATAPSRPPVHRFYDRIAKIELSAAVTVASADSAITCHALANGAREMWQPSQTCAGNTAILLGGVAAQEGVAYLFHHFGWHKAERISRFFTIEESLRAIRYTQKHGAL